MDIAKLREGVQKMSSKFIESPIRQRGWEQFAKHSDECRTGWISMCKREWHNGSVQQFGDINNSNGWGIWVVRESYLISLLLYEGNQRESELVMGLRWV